MKKEAGVGEGERSREEGRDGRNHGYKTMMTAG